MADSTTAPAPAAASAKGSPQDDHRHAWSTVPPVVLLALGIVVLFFWLWGNLTQIQTSEAWMLHLQSGSQTFSLLPNFSLFTQISAFFTGSLSGPALIADTWGWGIQIVLLVCSIGIERPQLFITRKYNKSLPFSESVAKSARSRAAIFKFVAVAMIIFNSVADFSYSAADGLWGQLAFSAITLTMSFFFGLIAYHLIDAAISEMRH